MTGGVLTYERSGWLPHDWWCADLRTTGVPHPRCCFCRPPKGKRLTVRFIAPKCALGLYIDYRMLLHPLLIIDYRMLLHPLLIISSCTCIVFLLTTVGANQAGSQKKQFPRKRRDVLLCTFKCRVLRGFLMCM